MEPAAVLALSDLEAHDPGARPGGTERRFLCPLPACADHQRPPGHRNVAVNTVTGAWNCHRCGAAGLLREFWADPEPRPPDRSGRNRARRRLSQAMQLPPPSPPAPPELTDSLRAALKRRLLPLPGSPAAAYLETRGLPPDMLATLPDVRFCADWPGVGAAVVFAIRRPGCRRPAAMQARALRGAEKRSAGPITAGLFWTPGAAEALRRREPLAITEAPIDALSLAAVGLPAVALCGKEIGAARQEWLLPMLAFCPLLLAFDADDAGDEAAAMSAPLLRDRCGAIARRFRPDTKDWNAQLQETGADTLRQWIAERVLFHKILPADEPWGGVPAPHVLDAPTGATDEAQEAIPAEGGAPGGALADAPPAWIDPAAAALEPFRDLILSAVDGDLPEGVSAPVAPGVTTICPRDTVLWNAKELIRLARASRGNTVDARAVIANLTTLAAWWEDYDPYSG